MPVQQRNTIVMQKYRVEHPTCVFQEPNKLQFPFPVKDGFKIFSFELDLLHTILQTPRFHCIGTLGPPLPPYFPGPLFQSTFPPPNSTLTQLPTKLSTISSSYLFPFIYKFLDLSSYSSNFYHIKHRIHVISRP
jgi:hypothetical protein